MDRICTIKSVDFFGLKLSVFHETEFLESIETALCEDQKLVCYGYSFGILPYFKKYPQLPFYAGNFDILGADGRGFYLLAKMLGYHLKSDLSIPNMVDRTLAIADDNSSSILLLGSKEEINLKASANLRKRYSNIKVLEGHHGYFKKDDEKLIVEFINEQSPNILLIGISSPIKERFAYKWKDELNCNIIIPCGGVIDIMAGAKKPTPRLIKKSGFAWLYRFVQEPRRLFRDSILNLLNVVFRLVPSIILHRYILRKDFSIPDFYSSNRRESIDQLSTK